MTRVGLTGGLGSGKSTVAQMFAELGASILDADKEVHRLFNEDKTVITNIEQKFGREVISRGLIDRKTLSGIVFSDKKKLKELEAIVHPRVIERLNAKAYKLEDDGIKIVIFDVPLLFEAGMHKEMDTVIVVFSDMDTRIQRSQDRLHINRQEALDRIDAQMPLEEKVRFADFTIDNSNDINTTERQVRTIWQNLQQKTKKA